MQLQQIRVNRVVWLVLGLSVLIGSCSFKDESAGPGTSVENKQPPDRGSLDTVNAKIIAGWAWKRADPEETVKVDLFDGETLLETVAADEFRQDLLNRGVGDGRHKFSFPTPDSLKDGKPHTIRAVISGTELELGGSPRTYQHDGT